MPVFRASSQAVTGSQDAGSPSDYEKVRALISDAMLPAHFYVRRAGAMEWQPPRAEELSWEIGVGRRQQLVDPVVDLAEELTPAPRFHAVSLHFRCAGGKGGSERLTEALRAADDAKDRVHAELPVVGYPAPEAIAPGPKAEQPVDVVTRLHVGEREDVGAADPLHA